VFLTFEKNSSVKSKFSPPGENFERCCKKITIYWGVKQKGGEGLSDKLIINHALQGERWLEKHRTRFFLKK
jgi:hypothetical protein